MEILLECCKKYTLHCNTTRLRKGMLANKDKLNADPPQKKRQKQPDEGGRQEEAYQ